MMAPVNLSARKAIQFWAKGDGQTYQMMVFSLRQGYRPAIQTFVAGPEWKQYHACRSPALETDGSDIMAFVWAAGPKTGKFTLALDNIRLQ